MTVTNQLKNQHLMWRAGFGVMAEDVPQVASVSQNDLVRALFKASSASPVYIDVASNYFKGLTMGIDEIARLQKKGLSEDEKKQQRKQSQEDIKSLNLAWLGEMVNSDAQLREKMSFFWHGHFASRNLNIYYQQLLLDAIRRNALGNFGNLLREVSKSAAMINFLNNNQNRKDHPNENFAREVMELFTMGRGNYTEDDVKEAARAFTGWGANLRGEFTLRPFQHDNGEKTFLGKTGNFDGDDILNMLLEKKQTAYFIAKKIYRFFVNDQLDEAMAAQLGEDFFQSNYDIRSLMEKIFKSDWFYAEKNIGSRIKSPVELIAGIRRILPMNIENEESLLIVQRLLGQLLFFPPNVAGWPGGANWIDSSTLMFRLRIPQIAYAADQFELKPKDDDDQLMGMREMGENMTNVKGFGKIGGGQMIRAQISWMTYLKNFDGIDRERLTAEISRRLFQVPATIDPVILKRNTDNSSREDFIKSTTIQLMSTPEFQLC